MSQMGQFTVNGVTEVKTITGDFGGPVPATLANINLVGSPNITVLGHPATSTIDLYIDNCVEHAIQVGNLAGGISSIAVGTAFQLLTGVTGAGPSWSATPTITSLVTTNTLTAGTNLVSIAGNLVLPATTAAVGQITLGAVPWIHGYGTGNVFMSVNSGNFTMTGSGNIGIGRYSLHSVTSANRNVSIGYQDANQLLTTGFNNTFIGTDSGSGLLTGSNCTLLGAETGYNYTGAESNNINIGFDTGGTTGESNVLRIGNGTGAGAGQLNKSFIRGIRGITTVNADAVAVLIDSSGQLGTVSSSIRFKENVNPMADSSSRIMDLSPVTFNYKTHPDLISYGLIAEDVEKVFPELVAYNSDGEPESVKYHDIPVLLLNEVQKLRHRIEELERGR